MLNYSTTVAAPAVAYENETVTFTITVNGVPNTTRAYYSGGSPAALDVPDIGVFGSWVGSLANLTAESGNHEVEVTFAEPGTYLVAASNAENFAEVHVLSGPGPTATVATTTVTVTTVIETLNDTTAEQQTTVSSTSAATTAPPPEGGPDSRLIIGAVFTVAVVVVLLWWLRRTGRAV